MQGAHKRVVSGNAETVLTLKRSAWTRLPLVTVFLVHSRGETVRVLRKAPVSWVLELVVEVEVEALRATTGAATEAVMVAIAAALAGILRGF
jgi:hypothetical protein